MINGPHLVREVLPTDESLSHQVPIAAIASLRREDGVFIENAPRDIRFLLDRMTELERYASILRTTELMELRPDEVLANLQGILDRTE